MVHLRTKTLGFRPRRRGRRTRRHRRRRSERSRPRLSFSHDRSYGPKELIKQKMALMRCKHHGVTPLFLLRQTVRKAKNSEASRLKLLGCGTRRAPAVRAAALENLRPQRDFRLTNSFLELNSPAFWLKTTKITWRRAGRLHVMSRHLLNRS